MGNSTRCPIALAVERATALNRASCGCARIYVGENFVNLSEIASGDLLLGFMEIFDDEIVEPFSFELNL